MRRVPLAALACLAVAADWPQWLGPNRDGSSTETVSPWKDAPKVLWRVPVGEGHSGPIVVDGKVYLHDKEPGKDAERLRVWDAATGKPTGSEAIRPRKAFSSPFGIGPRSTPATAGAAIIALGVTGNLTAVTWDNANAREDDFGSILDKFKAPTLTFGVSASPLVDGDRIIVTPGGKKASIVAFDRKTRQVAWSALDDPASYASPVILGTGKTRQLVVLTGLRVVGLNPESGELLWEHPFKDAIAESSTTPIRVGDLLIVSSVTLGSEALRMTENDGKPKVASVWKNPSLTCYFSTPVPFGPKHLLMVTGSLLPGGAASLRCVETATGQETWTRSKVGRYHASLLRLGDGNVLMLDDNGGLTLLAANTKEYTELARSKVSGVTWAHPALADGRLFLRDEKELIALQLRP